MKYFSGLLIVPNVPMTLCYCYLLLTLVGPLSAYGTQGDDTVIRLWFLSPRFIHRQILTIQIKQMTTKRERER